MRYEVEIENGQVTKNSTFTAQAGDTITFNIKGGDSGFLYSVARLMGKYWQPSITLKNFQGPADVSIKLMGKVGLAEDIGDPSKSATLDIQINPPDDEEGDA
ncbi:MAG: hypothetical protein QNK37_08065 [Acidobacteriota bacterium]|nr:hypothetical protein [Acidobacteriota bacterium]